MLADELVARPPAGWHRSSACRERQRGENNGQS